MKMSKPDHCVGAGRRSLAGRSRRIAFAATGAAAWIVVALLVAGVGCSEEEGDLTVSPDTAVPGETVYVNKPGAGFDDVEDIEVTFANKNGPIARIVDSSTLEVMVPMLPPDVVKLIVNHNGEQIGVTLFRVDHPPKLRLFLTMQDREIELERAQPYSGRYDRVARQGERLSYDVNHEGRIMFRGAIPHPKTATAEVFHDPLPGSMRRVPLVEPFHFTVTIPYFRGKTFVRFYEIGDTLDLADPGDLDSRQLLTEIYIAN